MALTSMPIVRAICTVGSADAAGVAKILLMAISTTR